MPHYMVQGAYTPETWARLIRTPEDREAALAPMIERMGGKLEALYFTFGQDDFVAMVEAPDNVTTAAMSIAVAATGALRSLRTTPLLTAQEAMEAMRKAQGSGYRPPGAS